MKLYNIGGSFGETRSVGVNAPCRCAGVPWWRARLRVCAVRVRVCWCEARRGAPVSRRRRVTRVVLYTSLRSTKEY